MSDVTEKSDAVTPEPKKNSEIMNFTELRLELLKEVGYLGAREQPFRSQIDWDTNKSEGILVDKASLEAGQPMELELIMVGEISSNNFYMTADGAYNPKTAFSNQKLENTKANCLLVAPRIEPWKTDFEHVVASLQWIQQQKATSATRRGLFKDGQVKVVHKLFLEKDKLSEEELESIMDIEDPSMKIDCWPVSVENQPLLTEIKQTHVVSPIPVIGYNDEPVQPEQYRQNLSGALVECRFAMSHWFINSDKIDTFNANLRSFKILSAPRPVPASPRKRIFTGKMNEGSSPKKLCL